MKLGKSMCLVAAACLMLTSGCATAFVRSPDSVHSGHVFPATTFDAEFFWRAGIQGEPLLATADPNARNGAVERVAYTFGAIIDFPFSVAFDTILLPVDLIRLKSSSDNTQRDPDTAGAFQTQ